MQEREKGGTNLNYDIRKQNGDLKRSFEYCYENLEKLLTDVFEKTTSEEVKELKKLLVIPNSDCLTSNYDNEIKNLGLGKLVSQGYILFAPTLKLLENEPSKTRILITFDDFKECRTNPYYLDYTIEIDVVCHADIWKLENFELRALKVLGILDGIIRNSKYGMGRTEYIGTKLVVPTEVMTGYCSKYRVYHEG